MIRKNKFGNKKTHIGSLTFDSKKEATRYLYLKSLSDSGVISELELQPKFELIPKFTSNGETHRPVTYSADFRYKSGVSIVVEDVKSEATAQDKTYIVKKKLFLYQNPEIIFIEV